MKDMSSTRKTVLQSIIISAVTGLFTGAVIFAFKYVSAGVISVSRQCYSFVRENPQYLPLLLVGAFVLALALTFLLKFEPNAKGGGIPTSIAALRGLISFNWLKNLITVFIAANVTYLCGFPLGNEGPSVQMGTAIGKGSAKLFGKRIPSGDKLVMTSGACAGFAAATLSPLTGILFAFEEAHKRFSPLIFTASATSVISSVTLVRVLSRLAGVSPALFEFDIKTQLPTRLIWIAVVIGIFCGLCAVLFTKCHSVVNRLLNNKLSNVPTFIKIGVIFVLSALAGFFIDELTGSGHSLIESLLHKSGVIYILFLYLVLRAFFLIFGNNAGVTGGLFLPRLTFGALIGAIIGTALISFGLVDIKYYPVIVIIGIASFIGASSKIPIMAVAFSIEALCGFSNIIAILVGVLISFAITEIAETKSFIDAVVDTKNKDIQKTDAP